MAKTKKAKVAFDLLSAKTACDLAALGSGDALGWYFADKPGSDLETLCVCIDDEDIPVLVNDCKLGEDQVCANWDFVIYASQHYRSAISEIIRLTKELKSVSAQPVSVQ